MNLNEDINNILNRYNSINESIKHFSDMFDENLNKNQYKLIKVPKTKLKIGNLYTFKYYNTSDVYKLYHSKIPFLDMHPIGLLINKDDKNITLYDLNIIPFQFKQILFKIINQKYKNIIEHNIKTKPINWIEFIDIEKYINELFKFNIGISKCTYQLSYIREIYAIDWTELSQMLFVNYEDSLFYNKNNGINKYKIIDILRKIKI